MTKSITTLALFLAATFVFASGTAQAQGIEIFLQGIDFSYDSGTGLIVDTGAPEDAVHTIEIKDDGVLVYGPETGTLDLSVPGVAGIPDTGGAVVSGGGGMFDIKFGDPAGSDGFIALDLGPADVVFTPGGGLGGVIDFIFSGSIAAVGSQSLPAGLSMTDPVSVSFSSQDVTTTTAGGFVTSFSAASGTGEVREVIPEPSSIGILALGGLLAGMGVIRYRLG